MNLENEVFNKLLKRIKETHEVIGKCKSLPQIQGKQKLLRRIEAELRFLHRLTENPEKLKEEHILSSNIYHLSAIVECCYKLEGVTKVLKTVSYVSNNSNELCESSITVDIVADYGKTWVKVATRNPHQLYQISVGCGKFGQKSILTQVQDLVRCASQNPCMFIPPKIILRLEAGITKELKDLLDKLPIEIIGDLVTTNTTSESLGDEESVIEQLANATIDLNLTDTQKDDMKFFNEKKMHAISKDDNSLLNIDAIPPDAVLNIDVSSFLAYVSNMTNGHCHAVYKEKLLTDLADMEKINPVKPVLDRLFQNRKLICCETAQKDFLEILKTVGGDMERERSKQILENVTVVPDNPSAKALTLETTSQIKERAKIVFGTGDNLKAVTVSANLGFLRAAISQGVKFVAFVHESRALTESKEIKS